MNYKKENYCDFAHEVIDASSMRGIAPNEPVYSLEERLVDSKGIDRNLRALALIVVGWKMVEVGRLLSISPPRVRQIINSVLKKTLPSLAGQPIGVLRLYRINILEMLTLFYS